MTKKRILHHKELFDKWYNEAEYHPEDSDYEREKVEYIILLHNTKKP